MNNLKILVPLHTLPTSKSLTTIFFDELLPVLKTKVNVHVLWLVYTPNKISLTNSQYENYTILDIHNYNNAIDVIQKEKPDLIFAETSWGFIDYALSSAAKFCNIPAFGIASNSLAIEKNLIENISSNAIRFFQNSIPTDSKQSNKFFMKRGRFFLFKYFFLLKTKFAMKKDIIHTLFTIWKFVLSDKLHIIFANDVVEFLESESLLNQRIKLGQKKSNLVVTGNPIYDSTFQKLSISKISDKKDGFINVLFAPSTLYEHGFWTHKQREFAVKETIRELRKNKNISITVKIHPSASILHEYESLIHQIDPLIPIYQKGDITKFLKNADVILSFQSSTAEVFALLSGKPIIICNFFDIKEDIFLERGMAVDCQNSSNLTKSIDCALKMNPATKQKCDDFIKDYLYKVDGLSSERISNEILKLIKT